MAQGFFITLEGGEGTGKSTQAARLADALRADGHEVVATREPGGAAGSEAIRNLLVNGPTGRWSPLAETLLFSAARDEHLRATIRPALARGAVVVCDRFADSTRAYQGSAGGVSGAAIRALEEWVVGPTKPDLTLILDLDPEVGLGRSDDRGEGGDRFERMDAAFHARLRAAFLEIAAAEPERCVVVDAAQPIEEVATGIAAIVRERLAAAMDKQPG